MAVATLVRMKRYREWSPGQASLMPVSPGDWLKEDHLVYFLLELLSSLDLLDIEVAIHAKDARGNRPYSPRMMVGLLLYGYCVGKVSSRKLERATYEEVPFRVLCGGQHPDHSAISMFRKVHLKALGGLFHQVLRLCREAGLVKLGHVALDGTKIKASASKHKANSYAGLERSEERLLEEIAEMLERAEAADAEEDARFGEERTGDELPDGLRTRAERLQKIQRAKAALEADAALTKALEKKEQATRAAKKANAGGSQVRAENAASEAEERAAHATDLARRRVAEATEHSAKLASQADDTASKRATTIARQQTEAAEKDLERTTALLDVSVDRDLEADENDDDSSDDSGAAAPMPASTQLPSRATKVDKYGAPVSSAQRNFTDPDSQLMKDGTGFAQAYNCQAAVDEENQVIVAAGLTNQASDSPHLVPMLRAVVGNCGAAPAVFTADAGYSSEANLKHCEASGVDAYIPSRRKAPAEPPDDAATRTEGEERARIAEMATKLATEQGRERYARRKWVGEAPFGNIKEARGLRQFVLRGIERTREEWNLMCAGHNLLKLFNAAQR